MLFRFTLLLPRATTASVPVPGGAVRDGVQSCYLQTELSRKMSQERFCKNVVLSNKCFVILIENEFEVVDCSRQSASHER